MLRKCSLVRMHTSSEVAMTFLFSQVHVSRTRSHRQNHYHSRRHLDHQPLPSVVRSLLAIQHHPIHHQTSGCNRSTQQTAFRDGCRLHHPPRPVRKIRIAGAGAKTLNTSRDWGKDRRCQHDTRKGQRDGGRHAGQPGEVCTLPMKRRRHSGHSGCAFGVLLA